MNNVIKIVNVNERDVVIHLHNVEKNNVHKMKNLNDLDKLN